MRQPNGRLTIEDNKTKDGTRLNNVRIDEAAVLNDGDVIRLGYNSIKFSERHRRAGEEASSPTSEAAKPAHSLGSSSPSSRPATATRPSAAPPPGADTSLKYQRQPRHTAYGSRVPPRALPPPLRRFRGKATGGTVARTTRQTSVRFARHCCRRVARFVRAARSPYPRGNTTVLFATSILLICQIIFLWFVFGAEYDQGPAAFLTKLSRSSGQGSISGITIAALDPNRRERFDRHQSKN